jgi:hypothetical protein
MPKKQNDPIHDRLVALETDMKWVKERLNSLDQRVWYILAGVIITILITILSKLL